MKCIYNFYIIVIVITVVTQVARAVSSSDELDDMELTHLSQKLNPIECLRLLEAMYLKRSMTDEEYEQSEKKIQLDDESVLRRQLKIYFLSHENCRLKLEQWKRNLPDKSNRWARVAMETVLRTLGRPDLANYIMRNRRVEPFFEEGPRLSRNAAKLATISARPFISKPVRVIPTEGKSKERPKEAVVQVYHTPQGAKTNRGSSERRGDVKGGHGGASTSEDDDSTTRWTAFLILLGIIALTILATVFFALYKNNRGKLFPIGDKKLDDCCPLADRLTRKPSSFDIDIEEGRLTTGGSQYGRRKKRGSSTQEQSRSPSSTCVREKFVPARKLKKKKFLRDIEQLQTQKLANRRNRRCDKNCTGIVKDETPPVPKIDKSTKTKPRQMSEKSNQFTNPPKKRLDVKKFHEKLANILKKDNPSCKCCKCSAFTNDAKVDETGISSKKIICSDDKCQKRRLRSIAELCFSSEDVSTRKESEGDSKRKKEKMMMMMKKKKKKKRRGKKSVKERDKDANNEKESVITSPENSARSKDKKDSKVTEKAPKRRKCDTNVACTRKTCTFRKSRTEEDMVIDNNVLRLDG